MGNRCSFAYKYPQSDIANYPVITRVLCILFLFIVCFYFSRNHFFDPLMYEKNAKTRIITH